MCNPANLDMTHNEMRQLIWRRVAEFADFAHVERVLENRNRADVYYGYKGVRIIVEIKTTLRQKWLEDAYKKYHTQCDYLILATPDRYMQLDIEDGCYHWRDRKADAVGIWTVTWLGIEERHPASAMPQKRAADGAPVLRPLPSLAVIGSPACAAKTP